MAPSRVSLPLDKLQTLHSHVQNIQSRSQPTLCMRILCLAVAPFKAIHFTFHFIATQNSDSEGKSRLFLWLSHTLDALSVRFVVDRGSLPPDIYSGAQTDSVIPLIQDCSTAGSSDQDFVGQSQDYGLH